MIDRPRRHPDETRGARRVVVVVPDLFFATRIATTAQALGIAIETPAPDAAFDTCRAAPPDLVVIDLHATGDPLGVVRRLKTDPSTRAIPILGFHAHVDVALRTAALDAGADRVLPRSAFSAKLAQLLAGETIGP